jgi:lipoate-protein ligase A
MNDAWFLLQQGKQPADYNMALDEALLQLAPELGRPVLRFYGWEEPAATFGYSQKYSEIERLTRLRPLVRRPTGGGLVPHDSDWTYSLVFPAGHDWYLLKAVESYERVHQWINDAFALINVRTELAPVAHKEIPGQCFVGCEKFDVLWSGRKIAGAAQRRTRAGLLIQGSVQPPPISLQRENWQSAMRAVEGREWKTLEISASLQSTVQRLRESKYSQLAYNQKR